MNELAGKAAIVTGAGRGLGAAYAQHIAELGASVVVNDLDPKATQATVDLILAAGGKAVAAPGDISVWDFGKTLVDACVDSFGTITGLVNNAGMFRPAVMDQVTERDFRLMLDVNVMGAAACAQAAVERLKTIGKGGSIINVTSGSQTGDIGLGAYGATKGAVASLTYSWAMELRGTGIRMNAISPLAETAMSQANAKLASAQMANRDVQYAALPPPSVSAPLVSFLLSDASKDINGQVIRLGGRQLSYVTHPLIAMPVLEDDWTLEKITAAFADTLGRHQHRLGLGVAGDSN